MSGFLMKLWRGEYSLPMAFLGFYLFGSAVAVFVVFMVLGIVAQFEPLFTPGLVLSLTMLTAYWLVASVGVWRSAGASLVSENRVSRLEAWLARAMVALLAVYGAWSLLNHGLGALWPDAPGSA